MIQSCQVTTYIKQQNKLVSFADKANQYRKHHLSDELIERANKPQNATRRTLVISKTTQAIVAIARQKLCKTRIEWFMSDTYMAKVTKCGTRQNRNIIGQIKGTKFNITRCRKRKGWVLKTLEINNPKRKYFSESKSSIAQDKQSIEEDHYKNNNSKRIRSSKSEFLNFSPKKETTRPDQKYRHQKFKTYNEPKDLSEHYPLNQEDAYELRKRCGKAYNLNAMNEILLNMSRKPKIQGHSFISKEKFMCYMTKSYRQEGRDVDKANRPNFKILRKRSKDEIDEIVTYNQQESYMKKVEDAAILNRTDYTQYRAKIAGQFPINLGYNLLNNILDIKKKDNIFIITMCKNVDLTHHYKELLLSNANAVGGYAGVDKIEFKYS